ncbi:MAG: alkanesulfonate monooxygenase SsuD [Gammaproteobacteria bacterium]|jgi:alkanesulfonate monooxygenase SsuD/methylene tetrahydromethanopterin reductase-like flavin-dependent oxidoreductase (luciferase family)
MNVRFGLLWPFRNPSFNRVPWQDLYRTHMDLIVQSEAMGYDNAWLTEHHFVDDGYSPSLLPIAGGIAARTSRIRIGTFLVLLPLHNPVRIAEDTATVDLMSDGRFDLGVGLGYRRKEFGDQGISHTERGARLREGIDIIQRLLSDEEVTIDGKFSKLNKIRIVPPALQKPHPPIWLGAVAEKAIERAAKMGFHFQVTGPTSSVEYYDTCLENAGRNPQEYNTAQLRWIHIAKSREQAWETAAQSLHHTAECYAKWFSEANDVPGDDQQTVGMPSVEEMIAKQEFDMFGENAIVGTPEDARGMIADYLSRGRVTHLVCGMAFAGLAPHHIRSSMEMFAKDVIPAFRK